jgi:hypothetical protein
MGQEILAPLTNIFSFNLPVPFFCGNLERFFVLSVVLSGMRFRRFCNNNPAACTEGSRFSHLD